MKTFDKNYFRDKQKQLAKEIIDICKNYYKCDFMVKSRKGKFVEKRQMCIFLVHDFCDGLTLQDIANIFNLKQHGTIIHNVKEIDHKMEIYEDLRFDYSCLVEIIEAQTDYERFSFYSRKQKYRKIQGITSVLSQLDKENLIELNELINNYLKSLQWKQ